MLSGLIIKCVHALVFPQYNYILKDSKYFCIDIKEKGEACQGHQVSSLCRAQKQRHHVLFVWSGAQALEKDWKPSRKRPIREVTVAIAARNNRHLDREVRLNSQNEVRLWWLAEQAIILCK